MKISPFLALLSYGFLIRDVASRTSEGGGLHGLFAATKDEDLECVHDREAAFRNAREGKACQWFYHITHHGGTTLTQLAESNGRSIDKDTKLLDSQDTSCSAASGGSTLFKQYQEYAITGSLGERVPCTRDDFVSIILVRDPLSRIMSHDAGDETNLESNFAHMDGCHTDNYGLRKFIGKMSLAEPVTMEDVEFAKRRLRSFDLIIDVGDYHNQATQLCEKLGWSNCEVEARDHQDPRDIMPAAIYEELSRKNQPEIAFYEYARQLAAARLQQNEPAFLQMKKKDDLVPKYQVAATAVQKVVERQDQEKSSTEKWVCE